jgi:hypothetical protein
LNFAGNIKRFAARRLQPDHPRTYQYVFILNVGKSPDGSVYLDDDENQGDHWSVCYVDKDKRTVSYADSLAYDVPTCLKQKITEFYGEIYGEDMNGFSFKKCHGHGRSDKKPACELVAIISTASACLAKSF